MIKHSRIKHFASIYFFLNCLFFFDLGMPAYGQNDLFRGRVEIKEYYTNLKVDVPMASRSRARRSKLPAAEFDTIYRRFTVCSDTVVMILSSQNRLKETKSIQIRGDYFYKSNNPYYIKMGRMPGSLLEFDKKDWKKVKKEELESGYDHYAIHAVNKTFRYYIDSDNAQDYSRQLTFQRLFSQLFNSFGTYRKVKVVSGEGDRMLIYSYEPDPNCDCRPLMEDLRLKDSATVDPNILPEVKISRELIPKSEREVLPFFESNDPIGQPYYASDLVGKVTYVDVWASWCVPCRAEMPFMKIIHDQYAGQDLHIVSISFDKPEALTKWLSASEVLAMTWTNWIIPDGFQSELAYELEIKGIPRYLLLDKHGHIANKYAPRPSDIEALVPLLNELIAE